MHFYILFSFLLNPNLDEQSNRLEFSVLIAIFSNRTFNLHSHRNISTEILDASWPDVDIDLFFRFN